MQEKKVQGRNSAESLSHWLVWCFTDVLFCLQNRSGCEAVSGPHPWTYSSTGLFQDVEETTVFSTDMFYEEEGLFQLLNSEILFFFLILIFVSIVYFWYKIPRYIVIFHVSLYCSLTIFPTVPFSFPFIRPLFLLDRLDSTLMSYVCAWSICVKILEQQMREDMVFVLEMYLTLSIIPSCIHFLKST